MSRPRFAVLWAVLSMGVPAGATTPEELDQLLSTGLACLPDQTCLEVITQGACAQGGCPRRGYNNNVADTVAYNPRLDLHGTKAAYLKDLRDAACAYPSATIPTANATFGGAVTLENLLWHQGEMTMRDESARFYNPPPPCTPLPNCTPITVLTPLTLADVKYPTSNNIDPSRFQYLTWVNEGGRAHAMTQADMGSWFLSVAHSWAYNDRPDKIDYYMLLARAAFRPYGVRSADGGVRNNKTGHLCYDNRYCYWFHSQSIETFSYPSTILNQHLHAVRDALEGYVFLASWRDNGLVSKTGVNYPLSALFGDGDLFIEQLKEWARGGLFQLAYASGSTVDQNAPPNLADFRKYEATWGGAPRYHAAYGYFFTGAKPSGVTNGPYDALTPNNCHYHYHSLALLASILDTIRDTPSLWSDAYFRDLYYKLLYGRAAGDNRACTTSMSTADRTMTNVPLAQYYWASMLPAVVMSFQDDCTGRYASEPTDFRNATGDYLLSGAFLQDAYANCLF